MPSIFERIATLFRRNKRLPPSREEETNQREKAEALVRIKKIYGREMPRDALDGAKIKSRNDVFFDLEEDAKARHIDIQSFDVTSRLSERFVLKLFENKALYDTFMQKMTEDIYHPQDDYFAGISVFERANGYRWIRQDYRGLVEAGMSLSEKLSGAALSRVYRSKEIINPQRLAKSPDGMFSLQIDDEIFAVKKTELIKALTEDEKSFAERFRDPNDLYSKKFAYALTRFVDPFNKPNYPYLFCAYDFPESAFDRYEKIKYMDVINFDDINKVTRTRTDISDRIKVSDELRKVIYDGMPTDLSELEKAIYIYARLSQTLQYDEDYYVDSNQEGRAFTRHHDIERIGTITPKNNKVVCYEFAYIYTKFMEENNIHHEVSKNPYTPDYTGQHVFPTVKADGIVMIVDSTKKGGWDIVATKVGQPFQGIVPQTISQNKIDRVCDAMTRVESLITPYRERIPVSELLRTYDAMDKSRPEISTTQRVEFVRDMLTTEKREAKEETTLTGVERIHYAQNLIRCMFGGDIIDPNHVTKRPEFLFAGRIDEKGENRLIGIVEFIERGKRKYFEISGNPSEKQFEESSAKKLYEDVATGRIREVGNGNAFSKGFIDRLRITAREEEREAEGR